MKAIKDEKVAAEGLTPQLNAVIIRALFSAKKQEQRMAWKAVVVQLSIVALAYILASATGTASQTIKGLLAGGGIAVINGVMLAWRMISAERLASFSAHQQLRFLYFYTAERYLVVLVLLGLSIAQSAMSAMAVVLGFVVGQGAWAVSRLLLKFRT